MNLKEVALEDTIDYL